ncbi:UDP-4-amino-4,6-dideoxy-N-acetyl-beta-L-altrosamine N-acetyltransferase [Photobacterium indicum]|uniref:UDP-4-amino-4, 6-dideoxy-N-acetyl-beta-L-altrosamine N-acetyltransferase n=1 Tax=Photobacterium indicum TaxID=81447 RepID=A0A2T3L827_9GAMM|nr:UDP-4-amino-4,6-dideoxy-N-acetyl-beta-L-altrosamine N-acetyltransferase [Photobacterium indicum]PSV46815.1 UDP-4-amino-4,6-dideoxy-N-acetyl-beta-L-altrosamine N-acetyltransferase [Photobacterium indicum]
MKKTTLMELEESHLDMILEWRNAPEVRKNMYTNHVISTEEHYAWFNKLQNDKTKKYFVFIKDNVPVGVIGFTEINLIKDTASWAFYANPTAPRGTGSMMEFFALDYAFKELKLHKLRCEVLSFNQMVVKLHTKFGFKVEGELRDAFYDGEQYHDVCHLGIFPQEWKEIRESLKKKLRL